jgi:5-methylcytosine-specific restriction endonuclease McrA
MREPSSAKRLPSPSNRVKSNQACQVWITYLKSSSSRPQSNQTKRRQSMRQNVVLSSKGRETKHKTTESGRRHPYEAAVMVIRQGAAEQIFSATSKWKLCQICSLPSPAVFPALVESPQSPGGANRSLEFWKLSRLSAFQPRSDS